VVGWIGFLFYKKKILLRVGFDRLFASGNWKVCIKEILMFKYKL